MDEPTPEDWVQVGNDMRRVYNDLAAILGIAPTPPMTTAGRAPTQEELAAYDKVSPGMGDRLREMARQEMEHRQAMTRLRRRARL